MNEEALAAALRQIGAGFYELASAIDGQESTILTAEEPSVHEAVKKQKDVNETRAGRPPAQPGETMPRVVNISAGKEKTTASAPEKEGYPAAALKALGKLDLAEATRPELKEVAEALGVYQQGQKASELRELLQSVLESEQKTPQAKGAKKPSAAPAADDEPEEPTYPDVKTMKKEFKLFCKVNRAAIEEENPEFFNEDDDSDNVEERLHQIVADEAVLKAAWRDNVWDVKQRGEWDALLQEAEAQVG